MAVRRQRHAVCRDAAAILAYIPAALMPDAMAQRPTRHFRLAALFVIRTLRLPIWWLLFPPLFESIWS